MPHDADASAHNRPPPLPFGLIRNRPAHLPKAGSCTPPRAIKGRSHSAPPRWFAARSAISRGVARPRTPLRHDFASARWMPVQHTRARDGSRTTAASLSRRARAVHFARGGTARRITNVLTNVERPLGYLPRRRADASMRRRSKSAPVTARRISRAAAEGSPKEFQSTRALPK